MAIRRALPSAAFTLAPCLTPGDRDKTTDLRVSEPDFFTRDLHEAVLAGRADCAVHSAKDLEDRLPAGIDWFWLPEPADQRDVVVLRTGESAELLPDGAIVGVSSQRREAYSRRAYPRLRPQGIRGTIEERLALLDAGRYDMLIMAAAALQRLGMQDRISRRIPLDELAPTPGQGSLAITFRCGDERFLRLRSLFVRAVVFAGAGSGSAESWTVGALDALARCNVCFHDSLLNAELLAHLPHGAERVDVGKRCGEHKASQGEINDWITAAARRGQRVVRLKGGDPGIFGRLAEEIAALDALHLPYRVISGVTSLAAATTGTGMLLTRRGVSRGFTVMTPRQQGGGCGSVDAAARSSLPIVFFMGVGLLPELVAQLTADGLPSNTPAAVVLDAGSVDEMVIRGSLSGIADKIAASLLAPDSRPGLIVVGAPAATAYRPEWGALMGRRILLPSSEALQAKAAGAVRDFGGVPVGLPLVRLSPDPAGIPALKRLKEFDWLVVTSPSAVHMLWRMMREAGVDIRKLPGILTAGPGTTEAFRSLGVVPDVTPARNFGSEGVLETVRQSVPGGAAILRVRSQLAGPDLAHALTEAGYRVEDCVLYRNDPVRPARIPAFDAVFFASASAVEAFMTLQPADALEGKVVVAMGRPTLAALERHGIVRARTPPEPSVESAIATLATAMVERVLGGFAETSPGSPSE